MATNDVSLTAQADMHREFDAVHVIENYTEQVTPLTTAKAEIVDEHNFVMVSIPET